MISIHDNNILLVKQVGELLVRYNEEINQLNKGVLDYYYNNSFDKKNLNNYEKELGIILDCFTKMKWNYIENGHKKLFLEEIRSEIQITTPSQATVQKLDKELLQIKNEFNENKEKTKSLLNIVGQVVNRFSDLNDKFQREKLNLDSLILKASEHIDRINVLLNPSKQQSHATKQQTQQQQFEKGSEIDKINSTVSWYKKYNSFISSLNGIYPTSKSFESDEMDSVEFELKFSINGNGNGNIVVHKLLIQFDSKVNLSKYCNGSNGNGNGVMPTIIGYTLTPNINDLNKLFQDYILDSRESPIESFTEVSELVSEFKNIISNYYYVESEIKDLSLRFKIKRSERCYGEISIQLPNEYTCNLYMDSDYPKYSTIELQSIQKPNSNVLVTSGLDFFKSNIEKYKWNLLQLIEEIDDSLK